MNKLIAALLLTAATGVATVSMAATPAGNAQPAAVVQTTTAAKPVVKAAVAKPAHHKVAHKKHVAKKHLTKKHVAKKHATKKHAVAKKHVAAK